MKLNNSGAYQWHTFYGAQDFSRTIAIDQESNIYVVSSSASSWQGGNGAAPRHAYSGGGDSAILKLSSKGTYLWHTFYGSSSSDSGVDIAVDGSNNIYVLGTSDAPWQNGTVTALHSYSGQIDLYVLKLNSAGTYQWHTFYGSSANDSAEGLTTDGSGNIYILGHSNSAWQGDQGVDALHPYHPVGTMFWNYVVMKLSPAGSYQWHTFYGYNDSGDGDIITDRVGNVYFTSGSYSGWLGDNDSPPLHQFDGSGEIVITRLNSAGGYQWHTFYGSNLIDYGEDLAMDERGSLVVVGGSTASWQGDGNSNPIHPYPAGAEVYALVVLKLDAVRLTQFYLPLIIGAAQPVSAIDPHSGENQR